MIVLPDSEQDFQPSSPQCWAYSWS